MGSPRLIPCGLVLVCGTHAGSPRCIPCGLNSGIYRENAIAIESEATDPFGGPKFIPCRLNSGILGPMWEAPDLSNVGC